jgi:hypothetical protein
VNHELKKTIAFVVVAVALTGAAFVSIPDLNPKDAEFTDKGKPFFPDFKDPNACTSLEVIDFDPATATVKPFKVQLKDGKWTIPSHYDYPADGKDRLVKTATGVVDLNKDTYRSGRAEDHELLGVVDPLDAKAGSLKGRGKKVTLKDATDKVLAEFIIGDPVKDRADQRYVRVPGQKATYSVNVNVDLSTRFADWIETNLLKLDVGKVRKVVFDSNKLDIARRRLVPGDVVTIERKDAATPWTLIGSEVPAGKELDTEKLFALTTALGDVKIVGVRPKPEGLTSELKAIGDLKELTGRAAWSSLIAMGFYPVEGRVVSNQGDIVVSTEDGAVYTLRFGEATFASGEALSKGADEAKAEPGKEKKDEKKDDKKPGATESRYLLVTVGFDPKLLPPLPDPDAGKPLDLPADVFHHEPGSPEKLAEEKVAKEKADKRKVEEDKRIAEAKTKVEELTDRFAGWYYVTPNEAFKSLALNKDNLFREKGAKPAPGPGGPEGFPGGFPGGIPGLSPGRPGGGRPMNPHGPG